MGFQGKSYLNDTKTEQDQTNRTDKAEDEIGQVVDNGKLRNLLKGRVKHEEKSD